MTNVTEEALSQPTVSQFTHITMTVVLGSALPVGIFSHFFLLWWTVKINIKRPRYALFLFDQVGSDRREYLVYRS